MTQMLMDQIQAYGIFAILFLFLFLYLLKETKTREENYRDIIEEQNKRETKYQVLITNYQSMVKKSQEIIDDYNKKEITFQGIIEQLMHQVANKEEIKKVEGEISNVKIDLIEIKNMIDESKKEIKGSDVYGRK